MCPAVTVATAIAIAATVQKKAQVVKVAVSRQAKAIHHQQRAHQRSHVNQNTQNHREIRAKIQLRPNTIHRT